MSQTRHSCAFCGDVRKAYEMSALAVVKYDLEREKLGDLSTMAKLPCCGSCFAEIEDLDVEEVLRAALAREIGEETTGSCEDPVDDDPA